MKLIYLICRLGLKLILISLQHSKSLWTWSLSPHFKFGDFQTLQTSSFKRNNVSDKNFIVVFYYSSIGISNCRNKHELLAKIIKCNCKYTWWLMEDMRGIQNHIIYSCKDLLQYIRIRENLSRLVFRYSFIVYLSF